MQKHYIVLFYKEDYVKKNGKVYRISRNLDNEFTLFHEVRKYHDSVPQSSCIHYYKKAF